MLPLERYLILTVILEKADAIQPVLLHQTQVKQLWKIILMYLLKKATAETGKQSSSTSWKNYSILVNNHLSVETLIFAVVATQLVLRECAVVDVV